DVRNRLGKESISGSRRGRARPDGGATRTWAPPAAAVGGAAPAVSGGDGGVCGGPLLGARDCQARAPGQADEPALCAPLRQIEQERRARRRGDLRGGGATIDAVRGAQERGAARHARVASGTLTVDPRAHGLDQPDARAAGRVWDRGGTRPGPTAAGAG